MWDCWLSISRRQRSAEEENSDYCEAEAGQRRGGGRKAKTCSADVAEEKSELGIHVFL